jgi:2,3-bisphosphoglycerate-independent phosphoglycerate mutase
VSTTAGHRPVVLIVLDGWGLAPPGPGNAIELASTPVFDSLLRRWPHTRIAASGHDVGLPAGQMGNSEVGHLNLGAGRVVPQDLVRLGTAVADGTLAENPALVAACERARAAGRPLHLMGLVSDGGVHSHVDHLRALVRMALAREVGEVRVHAITDGRDVSPSQAAGLLATLEEEWHGTAAAIRTVSGRIFAMDRDRRWERTERYWRCVVRGDAPSAPSASAAVRASYAAGITDEFVSPAVVGAPATATVAAGDELVFFNFRPDRARQVCRSLADPAFDGFDRGTPPPLVSLTTMTQYWEGQPGAIAFGELRPDTVLADVLETAAIPQLHAAETEKYPHVTYFFNGGREAEHAAEERLLVPSPRDVATYDLRPEMSAVALADGVVAALQDGRHGFAVVNFANPDMVGHTGVIPAVVRAVETVDAQLGRVLDAIADAGGVAIVTADHGNAERMLEDDGSPHTAHTTNPVPVVVTLDGVTLRDGGRLGDLAPTALELLGLPQPAQMTGRSLLQPA